jgi:hypothetical protein
MFTRSPISALVNLDAFASGMKLMPEDINVEKKQSSAGL